MSRALMLPALLSLALFTPAWAQAPVGTAFTYEGRLTDGGSPASGTFATP